MSYNKNIGPIDSAVLTYIGYKQTDKQTDRQAKIYRRSDLRISAAEVLKRTVFLIIDTGTVVNGKL